MAGRLPVEASLAFRHPHSMPCHVRYALLPQQQAAAQAFLPHKWAEAGSRLSPRRLRMHVSSPSTIAQAWLPPLTQFSGGRELPAALLAPGWCCWCWWWWCSCASLCCCSAPTCCAFACCLGLPCM